MDDPYAHLAYPLTDIVIPLTVIDELDGKKQRADTEGYHAREFLRTIEELRDDGPLVAPIELPEGSTLRIAPNGVAKAAIRDAGLPLKKGDHRIIGAALGVRENHPGADVTIVSNDAGLRVKAAVLGLHAQEHRPVAARTIDRTGIHEIDLGTYPRPGEPLTLSDLAPGIAEQIREEVHENEFVRIPGVGLAFRRVGNTLVSVQQDLHPYGVRGLNKEQKLALDLLHDPTVPLVTLRGNAGSGKSTLAIATGLDAVNRGDVDQLLILRPMIAVGHQEVGFLPGELNEKIGPWFDAVVDVIAAASEKKSGDRITMTEARARLESLIADGKVEQAPITFTRGRTFHRTFVIIDECQNLPRGVMKTLLSRVGKGSRVVILGDPGQIDVPYLSPATCGLNATIEALAGSPLFGHVTLTRGERSPLATFIGDRM